MGVRNEGWLNKEKLLFAAAGVLVVWTSVELVRSKPVLSPVGPHLVAEEAPPRLVTQDLLTRQPLSAYLIGARSNPFTFKEDVYVVGGVERPVEVEVTHRERPSRPERTPRKPDKPKPPVNPGEVPTRKPEPPQPAKEPEKPKPPKEAYELPVNFVGVFAKEGERYALLQDKQKDTYLKLVEGEKYPDLGIKVVRVTKSSVVLENEEGQRFLLRDLLRQILSERLESKKQE